MWIQEPPTIDVRKAGIDQTTPIVDRIGAEAISIFNGSVPKLVVEVKWEMDLFDYILK